MQRILVVDDDRLVADTLTMILELRGFACKAAYSTNEALGHAREFPPDLLLCDITMPGRDGIELIREMSSMVPQCRILVLTGYTKNVDRVHEESRSIGRHPAVLTKPCQPAKLLREAGAMLNRA